MIVWLLEKAATTRGEEAGKGSARVGRAEKQGWEGEAAAVEEGMVGKRSIGVPTFSCVLLPANLEFLQAD